MPSESPLIAAQDIRRSLRKVGTLRDQQEMKRFFKESIESYGVRVPVCRQMAREVARRVKAWPMEDVFRLCHQLLEDQKQETLLIAFALIESRKRDWRPTDFKRFEGWLKTYVTNWAACDDLCGVILGPFFLAFPEYVVKHRAWIHSKNRWVRRAAAVSLIDPIRKKEGMDEILFTATQLLEDEDDMVQKGYGWMLKEASRAFPHQVFEFVLGHRARMPRTALRYAIEKLPLAWKKQAMHK